MMSINLLFLSSCSILPGQIQCSRKEFKNCKSFCCWINSTSLNLQKVFLLDFAKCEKSIINFIFNFCLHDSDPFNEIFSIFFNIFIISKIRFENWNIKEIDDQWNIKGACVHVTFWLTFSLTIEIFVRTFRTRRGNKNHSWLSLFNTKK